MTTQTIMKARLASELRRSNITAAIASAITTAIEAHQSDRFYFNETRAFTFTTVANQGTYISTDSGWSNLANIIKFDYVKLYVSDQPYTLDPIPAEEIERLSANDTATGEPLGYCWFAESMRFYPIPNAARTVRVGAVAKVAAPATDGEASNKWMTDAELLIRCRAKFELYTHVLANPEAAAYFDPDRDGSPTNEAFRRLKRKTAQKVQQGGWATTPTTF